MGAFRVGSWSGGTEGVGDVGGAAVKWVLTVRPSGSRSSRLPWEFIRLGLAAFGFEVSGLEQVEEPTVSPSVSAALEAAERRRAVKAALEAVRTEVEALGGLIGAFEEVAESLERELEAAGQDAVN